MNRKELLFGQSGLRRSCLQFVIVTVTNTIAAGQADFQRPIPGFFTGVPLTFSQGAFAP
jgi:hypothetical protein